MRAGRFRAAWGAVLLALLLTAAAPAVASARRSVPRGFFGMVYNGPLLRASQAVQERQFEKMASAGVESVRTDFSWAAAEPRSNAPIDFSSSDRLVALAARHGMSLLPIILGTPAWARRDSSLSNSPPANPRDYAKYIAALAHRYGSRGSFWRQHPRLPRRPVLYWQIWNEPHLRLYWNAPHWERDYGALLRASHTALRLADRRAHIVLAGLTGSSWDALGALFRKGHVRGAFDVAALQTYTGSAQNLLFAVKLFRTVLDRYGAARTPLWITEMGWPAAKGRMSVPSYQRTIVTTDKGMAQKLARGYGALAFARARADLRVSRVYWYNWSSPYKPSRAAGAGIFDFSGLFRFDGRVFTQKPAYRAYVRTARSLEGCRKTPRGRCR